jgi:hypothetical protein
MLNRLFHAMFWTAVALPGVAAAQDLTVHAQWMVEPVADTYYASGVGSPTVAYDKKADLWVMYFETQFGPADAPGGTCDEGQWGLGRATSTDGLHWVVDADGLRISPEPGSYYSCVAAHPKVIYDGKKWRLWFKAQQQSTGCGANPVPSWGCKEVTGVGYAESEDGVDWVVTPEPILNLSTFGFPAVTQVDGVYRMLLSYSNTANGVYELWESVSTDDGATWTTPQAVIQPGFATWVEDEIYNPALACRPSSNNPYILWAGGRNSEGPPSARVIKTAGLGRAYSQDALTWPWDVHNPYVLWNLDPPSGPPDRDWRHWDVVRIKGDYLLYFSQRNDDGKNRIGLAYTYMGQQASFLEKRINDKICVIGLDTGSPDTGINDTGVPDDTDADTDVDTDPPETDTDADTDIDKCDLPGSKCGCRCDGAATAPPVVWLPFLGLALARRRRRV